MQGLSTFSIVAAAPQAGELGVAVQSKLIAVGAVVPWAKAGVGAMATQSYANTSHGPRGLEFLSQGLGPDETLARLISADQERQLRQMWMVDVQGRAASFAGEKCFPWAGHSVGENFACQGNVLAGKEVVEAIGFSAPHQGPPPPLPEAPEKARIFSGPSGW